MENVSHQFALPHQIQLNANVRLEKIAPIHSPSLFSQIDRHREFLSHYVQWTRFTHVLEDSLKFTAQCEKEAEQGESFVWAICVNNGKDNSFNAVGTISLNKPIDWQHRTALFGYWLSPEYQHQGIVSQSVQAVICATKTAFSHYILRCAVHNDASNNVAKRCGFLYEKTEEEAELIGDVRYAQNIYRKSV